MYNKCVQICSLQQFWILMHPILIGTILWLIVGLIVGWRILQRVRLNSVAGKQWQNQKIALVAIIFSGISMWLMWATCYLHQMYPLIEPIME